MAGIAAATGLAADPALAAGTVVAGVSTVVGLLAALWAVVVARGSPLEADGAAMWFVGGAVVGTAGWTGRRLVIERSQAWWRHVVVRGRGLRRTADGWAARSASLAKLSRSRAGGSVPMPTGQAPSIGPLIRRCTDATWPASFDRDQVLVEARRCFIALQAAWDTNDIAALRELTTPDMLADVLALLEARGHAPNHTDVLTLSAELLCIEAIGSAWCASLEFSGFIRESADAAAVPFHELWMLASAQDGALQWRLARQQALL